jgi:hypothetical protein
VCQLECITLEPLMPDAMCGGITFLGCAQSLSGSIFVPVKPGEYKFICDLPGHHEAGMNGTLIVGPFGPADELPSISGGVQKYTGGTVRPALLQRE